MNYDFAVRRRPLAALDMGQQVLVYDLGGRTLYKLGSAAADIWRCAEHPVTIDRLVRHVCPGSEKSVHFGEEVCGFVQRFVELFTCIPLDNLEQHELPQLSDRESGRDLTVDVLDEHRLRELYPDLINNPITEFGDKWPGCIAPAHPIFVGG